MKNFFLKSVLICFILFSCSSENENTEMPAEMVDVTTNRQPTGSSANDLLSNTFFKKLVVEIGYIEGFKPSQTAINNFKSFIESRINKSEGIEFITKQIPATGKTTYTINEIDEIEKQHRTQYNLGNKIAVWALFVNGKSSGDTNTKATLGSAYFNTSFVIYQETINGFSDSAFEPNRTVLETSVINHEFGHILGLTNLGTELQSDHEDPQNPKHCIEEDCLMFFALETGQGMVNMLSGGQVPTLDAQCLADLKANGGK
ncbi:membrane metalloprotease [Polaribacter aestuariivivens]|uniref:membrane metalloprotease n=1 Tax=Polaribacter aestuariivivens TaxID=2304626 RepID=UPI003F4989DF